MELDTSAVGTGPVRWVHPNVFWMVGGIAIGLAANAIANGIDRGWYWTWLTDDASPGGQSAFFFLSVIPLIAIGVWLGFQKSNHERHWLGVPFSVAGAMVVVTMWFYLGTEPAGKTVEQRSSDSITVWFTLSLIGAILGFVLVVAYILGRVVRWSTDQLGWESDGVVHRTVQNWRRVRPSERTRFVVRIGVIGLVMVVLWLQYRFQVFG
jgi:hypothetical protein